MSIIYDYLRYPYVHTICLFNVYVCSSHAYKHVNVTIHACHPQLGAQNESGLCPPHAPPPLKFWLDWFLIYTMREYRTKEGMGDGHNDGF